VKDYLISSEFFFAEVL